MESFNTLPGMLRYVLARYQNARAFSAVQQTQTASTNTQTPPDDADNTPTPLTWQHTSTERFAESVRRMSLGLIELGLKPGQTVGILADPSPWWLMADLAIFCAGGISVPLFPNSSQPNMNFKIRDAALRLVFVSDRSSVQRLGTYHRLFSKMIVPGSVCDLRNITGDQQLMQLGDNLSAKQPALFRENCERVQPDDPATIIYTSGSTGLPKGVVLTHKNLVSQINASAEWFPLDCAQDRALSLLPLAHVFERMVVYFCVSRGVSIWFADDPKNVAALMTDVKPTYMSVVPRVLEKVYAAMVAKVESAGLLSKPVGRWAIKIAHTELDETSKSDWRYAIAKRLIFPKMTRALGGQLNAVICGGSALSPRLCRFFLNIGVPVYQGYGMTEASPVISGNRPGENRVGTVGKPFPGVEVRIADNGEIQARGPSIMKGYHNNRAATVEAIDPDGWLRTGDLGRFDDDGYLTITGRIKELYKTATGKYVCPGSIEKALTASPLIDRAYVEAESRPYATALLFPDLKQARRILGNGNGSSGITDAELLKLPEMTAQVYQLLTLVNANLETWEQIRDYRFVREELTVENGGLTPTQKIRRDAVGERYNELIESMYNNAEAVA